MRKSQITDKGVLAELEKKNELAIKGQNILADMDKLDKEFNKNIALLKRIDEKVRTKVKKVMPEMGEYETVARVYVDKEDWFFEIIDRLEEFKSSFKKSNDNG